jgi:hypothetical protein
MSEEVETDVDWEDEVELDSTSITRLGAVRESVLPDESIISSFNIIFESVLFRFDFVLFKYYFLLELFYFN